MPIHTQRRTTPARRTALVLFKLAAVALVCIGAACTSSRGGVEAEPHRAILTTNAAVHSWLVNLLDGVEAPVLVRHAGDRGFGPGQLSPTHERLLSGGRLLVAVGGADEQKYIRRFRANHGAGADIIVLREDTEATRFDWLDPAVASGWIEELSNALRERYGPDAAPRIRENTAALQERISILAQRMGEDLGPYSGTGVLLLDRRAEPFVRAAGLEVAARYTARDGFVPSPEDAPAFLEAAGRLGVPVLVTYSDESWPTVAELAGESGIRTVTLDPIRTDFAADGDYEGRMALNIRNARLILALVHGAPAADSP